MSKTSRKLVGNFCDRTTCHCIGPLYNSTSVTARLFWASVLCFALIGTSYILHGVITDFLESPTATYVTVEHLAKIPFPSILICNDHSLNRTRLQERNISDELALYIQHIFMLTWDDFVVRYPKEHETELEAQYNSLLRQYPNQDIRELYLEVGVDCDAFLLSCNFHGSVGIFNCCDAFEARFHHQYGKCLLFSASPSQIANGFGLKLMIQPQYKNFFPAFGSESTGIAVYIHHYYNPFDYSPILVGPGQFATIQLEKDIIENHNTLFKTICDDTTEGMSIERCLFKCNHQIIEKNINCSFPFDNHEHPRTPSSFVKLHRICSPAEFLKCFNPETRIICFDGSDVYACTRTCMDSCIKHRIRHSVNSIPRKYKNADEEDQIFLDIYFRTFDVNRIRDVDTVTPVSVLANIGGAMGIFLGASLVTLVEFVAFAASFCSELFKRRNKYPISVGNPPRVNHNTVLPEDDL